MKMISSVVSDCVAVCA